METENQIIIKLLQEQNQTLHQLLQFHQKKEHDEKRTAIIRFIMHAIPYIAIIIIGYFLFMSIKGYLDALNNNINVLRDGFISFQTSIGKLIPDFSGIKEGIDSAWQTTKGLFK